MDITKLLDEQRKLDEMILKNAGVPSFMDVREKVGFALLVEIGELANEVQSFKYWKKNQNIDRTKILEEYSDGIHFLNTYVFNYEVGHVFKAKLVTEDINDQFLEVYKAVIDMIKVPSKDHIRYAYELYLGIAQLLKIDEDTIASEYFKKNLINQNRLKNNY